MRKNSVVVTALSMTVTALAGQSAYAQGSEADSIGLEEVVVTARKREESLQDVPLAVTALSAEQISDRQVQSIDDLARFTPGLVFAKAFGRSNDRPVIRGLASVLAGTNGTVETGAAYFVDGIYYPGDITSLDMADVARVEVIRGPQSALYGRNTYSGAVNFITRSPGDSFDGAASANFDKDEMGANLRLSGPLGEKAGGGVSMRYNKFDGQWVNQLTGKTIGSEESKSISGVLELTPTDDVTLRVRATWAEDRDGSRPLFFQSGGDNEPESVLLRRDPARPHFPERCSGDTADYAGQRNPDHTEHGLHASNGRRVRHASGPRVLGRGSRPRVGEFHWYLGYLRLGLHADRGWRRSRGQTEDRFR
jgi:iron complex outermembrane receptor protein